MNADTEIRELELWASENGAEIISTLRYYLSALSASEAQVAELTAENKLLRRIEAAATALHDAHYKGDPTDHLFHILDKSLAGPSTSSGQASGAMEKTTTPKSLKDIYPDPMDYT